MHKNRKSNSMEVSKAIYDISGIMLMIMLLPLFLIGLFVEIFCSNPKYR